MLKYTIHLSVICILLQGCSNTEPQLERETIQKEKEIEVPNSPSLFANQKNKLVQFAPKDERKKDPEIDALLKTVETAIQQKDLDLLFTVMDENITSSEGGGLFGYDGLMDTWGRDLNAFWEKLDWIVGMGGFFENESSYVLPYCDDFKRFPELPALLLDAAYGRGMCLSENTKLYPNRECKKSEGANIGYAFAGIDLNFEGDGEQGGVIKINPIGTGIHGFVKASEFYRSSDYSLRIYKRQGNWIITSFSPWD